MIRKLKRGKMYKHFKGAHYLILGVSEARESFKSIGQYRFINVTDTETKEKFDVLINVESGQIIHNYILKDTNLVIYRDMYKNSDIIWARELEMFLSPVDKEKYPEVEAEYRFEEIK